MNNKEFDDAINQLLGQSTPASNSLRREASIKAALNAFKEENELEETSVISQGSEQKARPNVNRDTYRRGGLFSNVTEPIRSFFMNTLNNRVAYNALGTIAIAFVAVSLVLVMPSMRTKTGIDELVGNREILEQDDTPTITKTEQVENTNDLIAVLPVEPRQVANSDVVRKVTEVTEKSETLIQFNEAEDKVAPKNAHLAAKPRSMAESPEPRTAANNDSSVLRKQKESSMNYRQGSTEGAARSEIVATTHKRMTGLTAGKLSDRTRSVTIVSSPSPDADISAPATTLDDREEYAKYKSNPIKLVQEEPVSTFSIDVDTASYSLVRNQLNNGYLPQPQAVRAEEFINYFDYDYPTPDSKKQPFTSSISVFDSPWNKGKKLIHIGIKGYDIPKHETPDSNLVFLLDVSGSMNSANKLPLVKQSISLLIETLKPSDTISMVVYAGAAGTVLEPTKVSEKHKIYAALQNLSAGGSTAGGAGIQLAYKLAEQNFDQQAVNRIILATDGDFNVGPSSNEDLKTLVERKRNSGVFLSVLGFGRNNYQDDMMQTLAQNGNGVAAFIDSLSEAKKVLVDEATSSLFTIAKDVKLQVEFNPATVSEYRLVGYETRHLNREDFNNDKVDAGEIGAGHTVTAIYEITPSDSTAASIDKPRYAQNTVGDFKQGKINEYGFLKIRYKLPNASKSTLIETAISKAHGKGKSKGNPEAQFSIAVAGFAQLLSRNNNTGNLSFDDVIEMANETKGVDPYGYRSEFIQIVRMAKIAK